MIEFPVNTYPKGSEKQVSANFQVHEFECPCKNCSETLIAPRLLELLEDLRVRFGMPIQIHSGYRCRNHQDELRAQGYETAKGISSHEQGWAADLSVPGCSGIELSLLARFVGFMAVGTAPTWIHVDLRQGKERRWIYS